jgi:hypothetical protein
MLSIYLRNCLCGTVVVLTISYNGEGGRPEFLRTLTLALPPSASSSNQCLQRACLPRSSK